MQNTKTISETGAKYKKAIGLFKHDELIALGRSQCASQWLRFHFIAGWKASSLPSTGTRLFSSFHARLEILASSAGERRRAPRSLLIAAASRPVSILIFPDLTIMLLPLTRSMLDRAAGRRIWYGSSRNSARPADCRRRAQLGSS
jgi:hypothetical protein